MKPKVYKYIFRIVRGTCIQYKNCQGYMQYILIAVLDKTIDQSLKWRRAS